MARIGLLCPDLLFGSKVVGMLAAAGHEVTPVAGADDLRSGAAFDALVVDLTAEVDERLAVMEELRAGEVLDAVATLAFYSHVETDTRARAEAAGFDRVVPRSRMAREGAALVDALLANADAGAGE